MTRATASEPPPAAHGTIKVSGRVGYSVAPEQPLAVSIATVSQQQRTTDSDLFIDQSRRHTDLARCGTASHHGEQADIRDAADQQHQTTANGHVRQTAWPSSVSEPDPATADCMHMFARDVAVDGRNEPQLEFRQRNG
jgi:hypothetical protein